MRHCGQLEHTPGLVNLKLTDDVRSNQIAGDAGRPVTYEGVYGAGIGLWSDVAPPGNVRFQTFVCVVKGRVLQRDGGRDTVAELGRVSNQVHTGDMVAAARKGIRAASRIALPRRVEERIARPNVNPANWMNALYRPSEAPPMVPVVLL